MLRLIETHCVPILSNAIEIMQIANRDEKRSLRVAYNAVFRRLFGYRLYESVSNLQHALGRPTWEELIDQRRAGFLRRARSCQSDTLVLLFADVSPFPLPLFFPPL